MQSEQNKKKVITHDGSFHPDDILAVATISLVEKGNVEIIRSRDSSVIKNGDYVADVGAQYDPSKNRFDHHQTGGAGSRANGGAPYASFGLVWKKFGEGLCGNDEVANRIDKKVVEPTDSFDNGFVNVPALYKDVYPYDLNKMIFSFRSTWQENERNEDRIFFELVRYAEVIIDREIKYMNDEVRGENIVKEIYDKAADKTIIELDRDYPWENVLSVRKEPLFVIMPNDNTFKVSAVRENAHSFRNRKNFPASWAGKRNQELAVVSGVPDAIFCHNGLFLAVSKSLDGARALAKIALEQ